jgi:hypothetical protein
MSSAAYDEVLSRIQCLDPADRIRLLEDLAALISPADQLRLAEELAALAHRRTTTRSPRSILELKGLGKEIWQGIDAQEYIAQERASWDG